MNVKKKKNASASSSEAQPLMQHVLALRRVLLISVGAAAAGFLLSFYFLRGYIMDFISRPIEAKGITLIYTAVSEALVTQLKVSLVAGIVLASPVIVWQIWSFIKPALSAVGSSWPWCCFCWASFSATSPYILWP